MAGSRSKERIRYRIAAMYRRALVSRRSLPTPPPERPTSSISPAVVRSIWQQPQDRSDGNEHQRDRRQTTARPLRSPFRENASGRVKILRTMFGEYPSQTLGCVAYAVDDLSGKKRVSTLRSPISRPRHTSSRTPGQCTSCGRKVRKRWYSSRIPFHSERLPRYN